MGLTLAVCRLSGEPHMAGTSVSKTSENVLHYVGGVEDGKTHRKVCSHPRGKEERNDFNFGVITGNNKKTTIKQ